MLWSPAPHTSPDGTDRPAAQLDRAKSRAHSILSGDTRGRSSVDRARDGVTGVRILSSPPCDRTTRLKNVWPLPRSQKGKGSTVWKLSRMRPGSK